MSVFSIFLLITFNNHTGDKMAEKKWKYENLIKLSDLKILMLNFQLATSVSVALRDESFSVIYTRQPAKKICGLFLEHANISDGCCDTVGESIFSFGVEGFSVIKCGKGLSFFVVPIKIDKETVIGYITGEVVFISREDKQAFSDKLKNNRELNLNFEEIRDYLRDIELISLQNYHAKANFLMTSVNMLIQNSIQKNEIEEASSLLVENHKLRSKAEKRVNSLLTLLELSKTINTITELDSLLNCIIKSIIRLLNADKCSIMLLNRHSQKLHIAASHNIEAEAVRSYSASLDDDIFGHVARSGDTLLIEDIAASEKYGKKSRPLYNRAKSLLIVPLKYKNEVIGVINVDNHENSSPFTEDDRVLFESIAEQTTVAIMNANFYSEASKKLDRLTALNKVSNIINSTLELESLLKTTITLISEVMGVEICSLMLLEGEPPELKIVVAHGLDENIIKSVRIKPGEGIAGHVARTGKPLLITDLSRDEKFSRYSKAGADYKTMSVLSAPLIIKEKVIGVINVNNKITSDVFNASDLQLLETLATQIATAIENARLYSQKEERLVEITMLHNLGLALNSSLDLKTIISQIIDSMKSIFAADMASIMLWDEKHEKLKIISHIGLPEDYIHALAFAPGEGVAGSVAASGRPRLIKNTLQEPSYKKHDILHDEKPKSLACAPIVVKNRVEGVICCERLLEKNGPFTNDNLNLLTTLSCHAAVAIENSNLYNDLLRVYLETVQSLAAALDAKDSYTHGHSRRVTGLALALAREIKMNDNEINTLKHAALLHDIGKIGIAESILQKPSSLTNEEFDCIKNHPITGARILESVEFLKSVCLQIKHHHERFDGRGYPDKLAGAQIPLGSRIIALADTYDAMTSTRPYRQGLSHETALEEIKRCAGSQFDPEVVEIFVKISEKCKNITEDIEFTNDNIINISGIKSMVDGIIKPINLF